MPETPLGSVVAIRQEEDPEVLKTFNDNQKKIRRDWRERGRKKENEAEYVASMDQLFAMAKA